jgi:hypothetical protein
MSLWPKSPGAHATMTVKQVLAALPYPGMNADPDKIEAWHWVETLCAAHGVDPAGRHLQPRQPRTAVTLAFFFAVDVRRGLLRGRGRMMLEIFCPPVCA